MTFRLTRDSFGVPGTGITDLNNAVCDWVSTICGASVHAMNMVYASTDCIFLHDSETHVAWCKKKISRKDNETGRRSDGALVISAPTHETQ